MADPAEQREPRDSAKPKASLTEKCLTDDDLGDQQLSKPRNLDDQMTQETAVTHTDQAPKGVYAHAERIARTLTAEQKEQIAERGEIILISLS